MNIQPPPIDSSWQNNRNAIISCHNTLQELYPGLKFRWARIYGRRWAYIFGGPGGDLTLGTFRIRLNERYGLCIDNPAVFSADDREILCENIREIIKDEKVFCNGDSKYPAK